MMSKFQPYVYMDYSGIYYFKDDSFNNNAQIQFESMYAVFESIEFLDSIVIGVIDYTSYPFLSYKKPNF